MTETEHGWRLIDEAAALLTRDYTFAPNATANCAVVRFAPDELLVVSPASRMPDEAFSALEPYGKVTAIVAPNGFHHVGIASWRHKFPDAKLYAPRAAQKRIRSKHKSETVLDVAELKARCQEGVDLLEPPSLRFGETWLDVKLKDARVWCVSDSIANLQKAPTGVIGALLRWTNSAPGFKINRFGRAIMVRDKPRYREWFSEQVERCAPTMVVPGHGRAYTSRDVQERLRDMASTL